MKLSGRAESQSFQEQGLEMNQNVRSEPDLAFTSHVVTHVI
jgi:hypothetical protein